MKKLITSYTGGQWLTIDDLDHIQNGFIEIMAELVQSDLFGGVSPVAMRGCVVTSPGSAASCTSGSIFFGSELFLVDTQAPIVGSGTLYWQITETYLSIDPIQFADGNNRSIHAIRKLTLTYTNPGSNGFLNSALTYYQSTAGQIIFLPSVAPAPAGYLQCNGAMADKTTYPNLFSKIGYNYSLQVLVSGGPAVATLQAGGFGNPAIIDLTGLTPAGSTYVNAYIVGTGAQPWITFNSVNYTISQGPKSTAGGNLLTIPEITGAGTISIIGGVTLAVVTGSANNFKLPNIPDISSGITLRAYIKY